MTSHSAIARAIFPLAVLLVLSWAGPANAQLAIGNWARTDPGGKGMTLTVEACCQGGLRLIYHLPAMGDQPPTDMTVDSPMNGTEVPVVMNGKPTGQTMAIKRVDAYHITGVVKYNGELTVTSSSTIAPDGKSARTESISHLSGEKTFTVIETWVRK